MLTIGCIGRKFSSSNLDPAPCFFSFTLNERLQKSLLLLVVGPVSQNLRQRFSFFKLSSSAQHIPGL